MRRTFYVMNRSGGSPVVGGDKLLTISGTTDATYVQWDLSATYLGAFRLDVGTYGSLSGNQASQDYNTNATIGIGSGSTKLLIGGGSNGDTFKSIGEFTIPTLSTSLTLTSLNIASNSHNYLDPFAAAPSNPGNWTTSAKVGGICTYNGRVMVNYYTFYDASNEADRSVMVLDDASTLTTSGARGFWPVLANPQTSHASGWISPIPSGLQAELGGTHIFGQSSGGKRSIIGRLPVGPSAFAYNADASDSIVGASPLANGSTLTTSTLLDYSLAAGMVAEANLDDAGYPWTQLSQAQYGFIVPGTRTYMAIGFSGGHSSGCTYGVSPWTGIQGFYQNTENDQANYYWLFDIDNFGGTSVQPYEYGVFGVPFSDNNSASVKVLGGAAFDPATDKLYIALEYADTSQASGSSGVPLILCYDMSGFA
jgi:hypothetical protein